MSFFNVFKTLLEELGDPEFLKYMEQSLEEKDKSLEKLRNEEERLRMEQTFLTMEHYTLSSLFNQIVYRKRYQEELELHLDSLLEETLKLGNILERVQWKNLFHYNELKNAEQKRKNECLQKEMKMMFQHMENRPAAIEFRREQRKKAKLETMLKDFDKAIANEQKSWQSKISAASQRRNNVILDLVIGSKSLKELHLKTVKNKLKQSVIKQNRFVQIFKSTERTIPSKAKNQDDKQITKSIENKLKMSLEIQTEPFVKPAKFSPDIHFNVYDFEKFAFENFQLKHKAIDDSFEKYPISNVRSIEENNSTNQEKLQRKSKRSEGQVKILKPEDSETKNENQNVSGVLEIFEGEQKQQEEEEVEESKSTSKESTVEAMEVDVLTKAELQNNDVKTINRKPIKKQQIVNMETPMLNLETEKESTIDSENDTFPFENSNVKKYISSFGEKKENEIKFHSIQDPMPTASFLQPIASDTNVANGNSPEKSDILKDLNPPNEDQRISFGDMFSTASEVSVDIQNEDERRVSFF